MLVRKKNKTTKPFIILRQITAIESHHLEIIHVSEACYLSFCTGYMSYIIQMNNNQHAGQLLSIPQN